MSNDGKIRVFARSMARDLTAEELEQVSGGIPKQTYCDQEYGTSILNTYTGVSELDPGQLDDSPIVDNDEGW